MPFLHFSNNLYILKVNARLSSGGRQSSAGQSSKYHHVQIQDGMFCTTSYQHSTDSVEMIELKLGFKTR